MKQLLILGFFFGATLFSLLSCQKELSEESNTNNATFSLKDDSSNTCISIPAVNGNYYNGVTAALPGNFVTIIVNVKSTGNYTISTGTNNGFSFRDSGFFSKIGLDTLILLPQGKPILIDSTSFSFGDSTCPFTVPLNDSTGTGLGGVDTSGTDTSGGSGATGGYSASYVDPKPAGNDTWHFTDSTNNKTYSGKMTLTSFLTPVLGGSGTLSSNSKEIFNFLINTPSITKGSYPLNGSNGMGLSNTSANPPTVDYAVTGSAPEEATDSSSINITDYSGGRIKISFRCWATDVNGKSALIKGSANSKVQ